MTPVLCVSPEEYQNMSSIPPIMVAEPVDPPGYKGEDAPEDDIFRDTNQPPPRRHTAMAGLCYQRQAEEGEQRSLVPATLELEEFLECIARIGHTKYCKVAQISLAQVLDRRAPRGGNHPEMGPSQVLPQPYDVAVTWRPRQHGRLCAGRSTTSLASVRTMRCARVVSARVSV